METGNGPTPIALPASLPYPITVSRISSPTSAQVNRGSPLFEYSFTSSSSLKALDRRSKGLPPQPGDKDAKEGDMVGTWDSELQGDLTHWEDWIQPGVIINRKQVGKTVVHVQQPCDHSIQFGGMCAICGTPLDNDDYLSRPNQEAQAGPSKKVFEMSHDSMGVTVSTNEAKRLETQSRDSLLSARKLTLIVDLDQTIIHTTVDATVGEWMAEIERSKRKSTATPIADSTTPPGSPAKLERNPFEEALEDVAKFEIPDDLPPGHSKRVGALNMERWYYTKPRPGVGKFLKDMSEKYEMHVYTMGTRTYADAICKVVDPKGEFFGDRILSRDESGSFNAKDLKRLFPTDQSMVVVIDDRSDVWSDVPNLVKVVPYTFFQGTGDVNSAFLPPLPNASGPSAISGGSTTPKADLPTPTAEEGKLAQAKMLDEQSQARPLAKLQAELDEKEAQAIPEEKSNHVTDGASQASSVEIKEDGEEEDKTKHSTKTTTPPGSPTRARKTVLNLYDDELNRVTEILRRIHHIFYRAYEGRRDRSFGARLPLECDVTVRCFSSLHGLADSRSIIPEMKASILENCHIVFSGVIPRHVKPQNSLEWQQAEIFGAECQLDVTSQTTHCVIRSEGTEKAFRAAAMGKRVVLLPWFEQCIALWSKIDETPYLAHRTRSSGDQGTESRVASGSATPNIIGAGPQLQTNDDISPVEDGGAGDEDANGDGAFDAETFEDDDDFLASIRAEAGIGDDESDFGGTEDNMSRHVPSSPPKSILASPRGSRAGSVDSDDGGSMPGTPRKRVRYADEESLPLESFKDPSPDAVSSPPRKRPRALLMPPGEDSVPEENRFQWKDKKRKPFDPPDSTENGESESVTEENAGDGEGTSNGDYEPSEVETEEDELAAMLREEMEDDS